MTTDSEQPKEESLLGPTLTMVFIHALIPVGLALFVLFRIPEYRELFQTAGVTLPWPTEAVMEFSESAGEHAVALFAFVGILLVGDGLGYYLLRRYAGTGWGKLWWGCVFFGECAILAGVFRLIVLPAREIMKSVP